METLSQFFPANIKYDISYDITPVVVASIKKVLTTLAEAVVLVFLVMLLFLQNIRYTIIPTVVVPVALLGTCGILLLLGFSINVLTLVRHGARHRHPGRRCDRRGGECRAHHVRGRTVAARRHPQGDGTNHRRHHRHHAGAGVGVRADGVLSRLGRHHLSAILRLHDRRDRPVVAAGAVADAGLVRDHPQAGRGRSSSRGARPVRLVQPPHGRGQGRLCGVGPLVDPARRPPDVDLCGDARGRRFRLHQAAGRLSAGRRPGLHHRRRAHAAGSVVSAHARRGQARRGLSD